MILLNTTFLTSAPAVFSYHRLQRFLVQTQVRHQLPQPAVLIAQLLGFLRLAHVHPAVLRLPRVDRVLRHSHFSCHVFRFASRLQLLQRSDDLGFAVLADRHRLFPFPSSDIILGLVRKTGIRSIQPGKPTQNAHVESFHGRLREECLAVSWFQNLFDARRKITRRSTFFQGDPNREVRCGDVGAYLPRKASQPQSVNTRNNSKSVEPLSVLCGSRK